MTGDDQAGALAGSPAVGRAPDGLELRHLRSFVAVAEELNFGRAASRLFISQPALSRQISALERQVGCELLLRSTRAVALTPAGQVLLDQSLRLLGEIDLAVAATRSAGGAIDPEVTRMWQGARGALAPDADLAHVREACEEFHARFPVPDVVVRPVTAGGVPALVVGPEPLQAPSVLYLHGGGYVMGSAFGHRHMAGAIAGASGCAVLVPDYRLAPEHPFPAAVDDAERALEWVVASGAPLEEVVVAGDSSGAGLVCSLLLSLRRGQRPQPGAAALLCPVLDLTFEALASAGTGADAALDVDQLHLFASWYGAGDLTDDLLAPLDADLSGLPALLVHTADGDSFSMDARRFADRATQAGVDVQFEQYAVATHDFHVFWSMLPVAAEAVGSVGAFVRARRSASR